MTPDRDLRPAGWGTDQPVAGQTVAGQPVTPRPPPVALRRYRNRWFLVLGIVLLVAGLAAGTLAIIGMVSDLALADEDIVAGGTVAALDGPETEAVSFTAESDGPFTVWLDNENMETLTREDVVAATQCEAQLSNGDTARFQGNRQGNNVTVGSRSTVGYFDAVEGDVEVSCRQVEFGRPGRYGRLRHERDYIVARGEPSTPFAGVGLLTGGIIALVLAIFSIITWGRGKVRPISGEG